MELLKGSGWTSTGRGLVSFDYRNKTYLACRLRLVPLLRYFAASLSHCLPDLCESSYGNRSLFVIDGFESSFL